MTDWKAVYAKRDMLEAQRHRKTQKNTANLQRRLSSSANSHRRTLSLLFSNPFSGSSVTQPVSSRRIESSIEELRSQVGVISEVLHGIERNIENNHEAQLDRLDAVKAQISRESQRLMAAIRTIRQRSNCDLSDPSTYIYCLQLIYILIFRIFKFLCELVFLLGNSFKDFLCHMPFPFSLLVFIAYIFQMVLIVIIFDTTMRVSTLGISHRQFIHHNALYERYPGAPEWISPRHALYEGVFVSCMTALSHMIMLLNASYNFVLGDIGEMVHGVSGRYISSDTVIQGVREHVVEKTKSAVNDAVNEAVNEVVNDQLGIMASVPSKLGDLAVKSAEGASSVAQGAASLAGKAVRGVGEGLSARAERWKQINTEDVKSAASAAAEAAKDTATGIYHQVRRFKSGMFGGSSTRSNGSKRSRSRKMTLKNNVDIPVFSILTKKEQYEFNKTTAGKKLKQIEEILKGIDYSKIKPNPHDFYIIRFALNASERLFPIFVQQLHKTIDVCKMMEKKKIQPISNPLFLKKLNHIVSQ